MAKGKLFWNRTWNYNDETVPIPAIKEYLPGAKVELFVGASAASLALHEQGFLTDDGEFAFVNVPQAAAAEIKISLEYKDSKVVVMKGETNHVAEAKFEIKKDNVIWHQPKSGSWVEGGEREVLETKEDERQRRAQRASPTG